MHSYQVNRTGYKVVMDLKRFLESGDSKKISKGLYQELTAHCGFIAHYDLHNFRLEFDGDPAKLLEGEFYPLASLPDPVSVYEYSDGLSSKEVIEGFRRVAGSF